MKAYRFVVPALLLVAPAAAQSPGDRKEPHPTPPEYAPIKPGPIEQCKAAKEEIMNCTVSITFTEDGKYSLCSCNEVDPKPVYGEDMQNATSQAEGLIEGAPPIDRLSTVTVANALESSLARRCTVVIIGGHRYCL